MNQSVVSCWTPVSRDQVEVRHNAGSACALGGGHAARFAMKRDGTFAPFCSARAIIPGIRQLGIESAPFQLETVEGVMPKALATATVPPSLSMNLETVCITDLIRYS